jgi:hypothetical protein
MPRVHQFSAGFQYLVARNSVIDVPTSATARWLLRKHEPQLPGWSFANNAI